MLNTFLVSHPLVDYATSDYVQCKSSIVSIVKVVIHVEMPKAAPKKSMSFSKTRDDIEMK